MNPKVMNVEPLNDFKLRVVFVNGDAKIFDVNPYLEKGIFTELKDKNYFKQVKVVAGAIQWPNEQDFSNDTLYIRGQSL